MKVGDILCYIDRDVDFRIVTKGHSNIYSGWVYEYDGSYNEKSINFISGGEDERGPYIVVEVE